MRLKPAIMALLLLLTAGVVKADPVDYIHPKKDVLSGEQTVGPEGVIYHGMQYPATAPTYFGGYVKLTAENEGDPVMITFTEFNCLRDGKPIVFLYDGDEILKANFTSYSKPVPEGYLKAVLPEDVGTEFMAESGTLCVLYAPASKSDFVTTPYGNISGNYTATVTAGVPKDMEYGSATLAGCTEPLWRGKENATLSTLSILNDGTLNPLTMQSLTFDVATLLESGKVGNLRLYDGVVNADALLATRGDGATTLTLSNRTLKAKNTILLVGDIKADATGELPSAEVADLTIDGISRTVASDGTTAEIPNTILMPADDRHITFTISDTANFFDAGGKEGKTPIESKGTITFIPADAGSVIKIEPTVWDLFNTSSVGKNDIFRVYAGREADPDKLITELLDKPRIINSPAEDGSLTIYFESQNGNTSGARAGWEALVSQIVPSQMVCTGVNHLNFQTPTVAAGESNVRVALFDIHTDNTLNPLKLSNLKFSFGPNTNPAEVAAISVSYLGDDATNSVIADYGRTADGATTISGDLTLAEGANIFAIAISLNPTATTGSPLELTLESANVGEAVVEAEEVDVVTTVDNTCVLTEGTHSHTLYGPWGFTHNPSTVASGKYEGSTNNHIVTFTPSDPSARAQIAFEDFAITYSTSAYYGVKATFEVYNGAGTDGELLWKVDDATKAANGPGKKLRSTAADGSLTVKFNPNDVSSYYCDKGWHAIVTPFIDHAAEITGVTVNQTSSAIVGPGTTDAELIDFDINVEGTLSPLILHSVKLNVKGAAQIGRLSIYSTTDGTMDTATLWGTLEPESDTDEAQTFTITPQGEALPALAEESNRFFVLFDLKPTIKGEVEIDATLESLNLGGTTEYAVADGNPEGSRVTKNIYILGSESAQRVVVGEPLIFYDNGGPEGNASSFTGTVTFVPASPNQLLVLSTNSFSIGGGKIYVYSGQEVDAANQLGKITGYFTTTGPDNLISKADDGSLTLSVKLIGTSLAGFEMSVTPVQMVHHHIATATVEDYSTYAATRGGNDVPLAHLTMTVEGNKDLLPIEGIQLDFSGSDNAADLLNAGLYYSGTNATFAPNMLCGAKTALNADGTATVTLEEPVAIDEPGEYHFWIGGDISATAQPGNTLRLTIPAINADNSAFTLTDNNSASRAVKAGMAGNYRVGASDKADYATIADAVEALNGGMEGTVMLMLEDGDYKEDIVIRDVEGTSADNLLILTSLSGNRDNVVIAGGKSYASNSDALVTVANTPWVNFRSLTFRPTATGYGVLVNYRNSSRNGTVDNCVIEGPALADGTSTGTVPVKVENASSSETDNQKNTECDYFTLKNSHVLNGYIGVSLNSLGYVGETQAKGMKVTGNTIEGYASKGIYVNTISDFEISGNTISRSNITKSSIYAMDVYNAHGEFVIDSNRLTHEMPVSVGATSVNNTVLYMRGAWSNIGGPSAGRPARVTNNVIILNNSRHYTSYGMSMAKSYANMLIAHNSIAVTTPGSERAGYALGLLSPALTSNTGLQVRNNILQANSGSESANSSPLNVWGDSDYANIAFSGNVYYSQSGKIDNQSPAHTLEEYQTLSGDMTSVFLHADFYSDLDLHLLSADGMEVPRLESVASDAEGTLRGELTTAGAYEYAEVNTDTPVIAEGYPRVGRLTPQSAAVTGRWSVGGSVYAMIQSADAEAPTEEALMAQRPVSADADTDVEYTFNYLEPQTSYRAWLMCVSAIGNRSAISATEPFTTPELIGELAVEISWDEEPLHGGEYVLMQAEISGGQAPYTISWTDRMNTEVGSEEVLMLEANGAETYRVTVSSADGQRVTAKAHVDVYDPELRIATFDDLALEEESNWKYDPFNSEDTMTDSFYSGSFRFPNYPWMQYGAWSGYGFANETATDFVTYDHQFRNAAGGGALNTSGYGVAYMYGADTRITLMADPESEGHEVPGMYVVNSAYTLNSILNGDGWCQKFTAENGDYYTVTVEGLDLNGSSTGVVRIPMADFRESAAEAVALAEEEQTPSDVVAGNIVDKWKWVDLSPLGRVHQLRFGFESSQQSQVPAYICFDQLGAKSSAMGVEAVRSAQDASLAYRNGSIFAVSPSEVSTLTIYASDGSARILRRFEGSLDFRPEELPAGVYIARLTGEGIAPVTLKFVRK